MDVETPKNGKPQLRRQIRLVQTVIESGRMSVEELADFLEVSVPTVYRDVSQLETEGLVRIDRGQVRSASTSMSDMPTELRDSIQSEAKKSFAPIVQKLIPRGSSVIIDDSTTVFPSLDGLGNNAPLTVITNSLSVIRRIKTTAGMTVHGLGGRFYPASNAFYGPLTISALDSFQADFVLMSDTAICDGYLCNPNDMVAETKKAMIFLAKTRVLLADHTKFLSSSLVRTARVTDFDYLITDREPNELIRAMCEKSNTKILVSENQ